MSEFFLTIFIFTFFSHQLNKLQGEIKNKREKLEKKEKRKRGKKNKTHYST